MNLTLLSAAIAAALGFGTAWSIQSQRLTKLELNHAETRIANQSAARKVLERVTLQVSTAQNDAVERGRVLADAAAASRRESDGLRQSIATAMRASAVSHDACNRIVTAQSVVLAAGSEFIQRLAGDADQCFSDQRLMQDAWPR